MSFRKKKLFGKRWLREKEYYYSLSMQVCEGAEREEEREPHMLSP